MGATYVIRSLRKSTSSDYQYEADVDLIGFED